MSTTVNRLFAAVAALGGICFLATAGIAIFDSWTTLDIIVGWLLVPTGVYLVYAGWLLWREEI